MISLSRRTVLRTAAAGAAVSGAQSVAGPASAAGASAIADPHRSGVRDASLVWHTAPGDRAAGPVLGNGTLVAEVMIDAGRGVLSFPMTSGGGALTAAAPTLDLTPAGKPTGLRLELDLWNAELSGVLTTTRGAVAFRAFVPHGHDALVVQLTAGRGRWGVTAADGSAAVVRHESARVVVAALAGAADPDAGTHAQLQATHRQRWNAYYRAGFVSLPDRAVQRFHWVQQYLAAALPPAAGGAATDLLSTSNHPELNPFAAAGTVTEAAGHDHVRYGIPGVGASLGGAVNPVAAWELPARWRAYQHSGDTELLRDSLFPLLRRAIGFYGHFLTEGADGRLHLPVTRSPGHPDVADSTHDLAQLRWAVRTALTAASRLGSADPDRARWSDILQRLVPYHRDATGVLLGAGVRLPASHPHAPHLAWIHPLREAHWSDPAGRDEMLRGYRHWTGMTQAWQPESYATAAALAGAVRQGDDAARHLGRFVGLGVVNGHGLQHNGLYRRGGEVVPRVAFAAARTLLGLLTDDGPDGVTVFPAVPGGWGDVSVSGLRLPGDILVDASRRDGRTDWVRIRAGAVQLLTLRHGIPGKVTIHNGSGAPRSVVQSGAGFTSLRTAPGDEIVIARVGADVEPV